MSSITITDLLTEPNITDKDYDDWDIVRKTPIVPRLMIEMIIKKCDQDIEEFDSGSNISEAVRAEARNIKNYAESLLDQFEKDDFSNTEESLLFD